MNTVELRQQRAELVAKARAITDKAEEEKRDLTGEDQGEFDRIMDAAEQLERQFTRIEKLETVERSLGESRGRISTPDKFEKADTRKSAVTRAWSKFLRGDGPEEYRDLVADSNAGGGYFVAPLEFNEELLKTIDKLNPISELATKKHLEGALSLGTPVLTKASDATWEAEVNVSTADTTMASGRRDLTPHKLSKRIIVSNKELLFSPLDAQEIVLRDMARSNAEALENGYTNGSGSMQALGLFTPSDVGLPTSQDVNTGNTTTALIGDNLISAFYKLRPGYRRNAVWLMHSDVIAAVRKLKDDEGRYIWQPSLAPGSPDTIMGRPVVDSEYAPNTFTASQYLYVFFDPTYYWICTTGTIQVQILHELYAGSDSTGFISRGYFDAALVIGEAGVRGQLASS